MTSPDSTAQVMVPIVGVGASAGGLAAFERLFEHLPAGANLAVIVIQHLPPDHKTLLPELIAHHTAMPVRQIETGMRVEPNAVYVVPPGQVVGFDGESLRLIEADHHHPIDAVFRALAEAHGERAIAVVLSGTGSDGTEGARAIKDHDGLVVVQEPSSAEFDGMPQSAVDAGVADLVLPPAKMPDRIVGYLRQRFGVQPHDDDTPVEGDDAPAVICGLLREHTGHDFSDYKPTTLARRTQRRMAIRHIADLSGYVQFLRDNPGELDALFHDLLIGVTRFFRDTDAFEVLERKVIPRLFADRDVDDEVRIWVAGCSTGEEAYSVAILLREELDRVHKAHKVQVFATDIDSRAIATARRGVFPSAIAADVSPERLARFFNHDPVTNTYRIRKPVRDLIVFSEQSLIKDPPFSRIDLLVVRNLLIYMDAELQQRLIRLFHYALKPGGVLFLGSAESLGEASSLFDPLDRQWKIYRRGGDGRLAATPAWKPAGSAQGVDRGAPALHLRPARQSGPDWTALIAEAVLEHVAPIAVLIDSHGDILYIQGRTGQFLEPAEGDAEMNIVAMARQGVRRELTTAIHRAVTSNKPARRTGLRVQTNRHEVVADLVVRPVDVPPSQPVSVPVYLVLFENIRTGNASEEPAVATVSPEQAGTVAQLQQEIEDQEEYQKALQEELESSNDELRFFNQELQSVNEELQASNEELETSKEEMQSINEELATVNSELQSKIAELTRANNDMNNLLAGTGVGTLFVDTDLRITRFTPATTQVIHLIQSDVGRPVDHTVTNLVNYSQLADDIRDVLNNLTTVDAEVQTKSGAWYLMRIRPYRTPVNVIEGAVITFVDITQRKQAEAALRDAKNLAEAIVQTIDEPLLVLDSDARVLLVNDGLCQTFGLDREEVVNRELLAILGAGWDAELVQHRLDKVLSGASEAEEFEMTRQPADRESSRFRLKFCRIHRAQDTNHPLALLVMRPVPRNTAQAG